MVTATISSFIIGLLGKVDPLGAAPLLRFNTNTIIVIVIVLLVALGLWYYMRRGQSGSPKGPLKHIEASNETIP